MRKSRRELLVGTVAIGASFALASCRSVERPPEQPKSEAPTADDGDDVGATEDLMREHGILRRILFVYDECARRLEAGNDPPPNVLPTAARLVRTFVHDYHEKLEEDFVFPRCEQALVHTALVRALRDQHAIARKLTATIEQAVGGSRKKLAAHLRAFARMYRPHAAREDTVLFPAFDALLAPGEREAIGAEFAQRERALFGDDGFERKVAEVSELETALDLNDLARLSPAELR